MKGFLASYILWTEHIEQGSANVYASTSDSELWEFFHSPESVLHLKCSHS